MRRWQVYLSIGSDFVSSYTYITAENVSQTGTTSVNADGIEIDFGNEVLSVSEVLQ